MEDIGENLVGCCLRYVEGCQFIVFNTHIPGSQGEVDVLGIKLGAPRSIFFSEVSTHLTGMLYGDNNATTVQKIRDKIERARTFATTTFPGDVHRFQIWCPYVPSGLLKQLADLGATYRTADLNLELVVNEHYAERVQALVERARKDTSDCKEPAYRLLQVLTHLKGTVRT